MGSIKRAGPAATGHCPKHKSYCLSALVAELKRFRKERAQFARSSQLV